MNLKSLIGQQFDEMYLFELLLFDIEQDREQFRGRFLHLFFDQLPNQQILITELCEYASHDEYSDAGKAFLGRRPTIQIQQQDKITELILARLDRNCECAWVSPEYTNRQTSRLICMELEPNHVPLTAEEKRLAFSELLGAFEDHKERELLSRRKRSV